ncbi:MAG: DUF131 domain-containing protein [Candidatus Nezhaarchaeales archaeon]
MGLDPVALASLAMLLILAGLALIVLSITASGGRASGGGLVMIGPLPIVFGTSARAVKLLLALAALLLALLALYAAWPLAVWRPSGLP